MPKHFNRAVDLCAGEGDITKHLKASDVTAVELDDKRVRKGRKIATKAKWLRRDIQTDDFYDELKTWEPFETVVMNPPFGLGMFALAIAADMIRGNGRNRVVALLPSDYFLSARLRREQYRSLGLDITKEYKVGHWPYIDGNPNLKPTPDSVFVFRRSKRPTFSHRTFDTRLSGKLDEQRSSVNFIAEPASGLRAGS